MNIERRMSKSGTIGIPSSLRRQLGFDEKEKVNLCVKDDGKIVIERIEGTCIFCGSVENVKAFKKRFVCDKCTKELGGK